MDKTLNRISIRGQSFAHYCPANTSSNELGSIVVMIAISAFLIVLLGMGLMIQRPIQDANSSKLQHSFTVASADGLYHITHPTDAAELASSSAKNIVDNLYSSVRSGNYGEGLATLHVWIPTTGPTMSVGTGSTLPTFANFNVFNCSDGACVECFTTDTCKPTDTNIPYNISDQLKAAQFTFDQRNANNQIDDFYNGMMLYGLSKPTSLGDYLGLGKSLSNYQVSVAASRLQYQLTYVLIDPAMSLHDSFGGAGTSPLAVYENIFGESVVSGSPDSRLIPDALQWPLRTRRDLDYAGDCGSNLTCYDWPSYPAATGLAAKDPYNTTDLSAYPEIYRFFASLCFNEPWDNFRGAIVDFIDYLSSSSAYSSTTLVGLTAPGPYLPYDVRRNALTGNQEILNNPPIPGSPPSISPNYDVFPVIPVFPAQVGAQGWDVHPTAYPIAQLLHEPRTPVWNGFVDSQDPAAGANWGAGTPVAGTAGINDWSLVCRMFVGDTGNSNSTYTLTEDRVSPGRPTDMSHRDETLRERTTSTGNPSWLSDNVAPRHGVNVSFSQSSGGSGESARNIVASLAPRVKSLSTVIDDVVTDSSSWKASTYMPTADISGFDYAGPNSKLYYPLSPGYRDVAASLTRVCDTLNTIQASNNADSFFGVHRPIPAEAVNVVVFGFGFWSPLTLDYINRFEGLGLGINALITEMRNRLVAALNNCLCSRQIRVFFVMLPLNEFDRRSVIEAQNAVNFYRSQEDAKCIDLEPPSSCNNPRVDLLVADYRNDFFAEDSDGVQQLFPNTNDQDLAEVKRLAAFFYRHTLAKIIMRRIGQFNWGI